MRNNGGGLPNNWNVPFPPNRQWRICGIKSSVRTPLTEGIGTGASIANDTIASLITAGCNGVALLVKLPGAPTPRLHRHPLELPLPHLHPAEISRIFHVILLRRQSCRQRVVTVVISGADSGITCTFGTGASGTDTTDTAAITKL
jgi:hypothetical protein